MDELQRPGGPAAWVEDPIADVLPRLVFVVDPGVGSGVSGPARGRETLPLFVPQIEVEAFVRFQARRSGLAPIVGPCELRAAVPVAVFVAAPPRPILLARRVAAISQGGGVDVAKVLQPGVVAAAV